MPPRAIITGSNRGIGRAIAEALRDRGYELASINKTIDGAPWLGEIQCDLRDSDATRDAVQIAIGRLGGVDLCIANAAVRRLTGCAQMSDEDWSDSIAVNLTSVFILAREAIPALRSSRGHLIVIGSQAARQAFEGGAAYCATKAALKALCEVLILEEQPAGLRVTLVSPWATRNRPKNLDDHKMDPASVAAVVVSLADAPSDVLIGELELRPMNPLRSEVSGIDRLTIL